MTVEKLKFMVKRKTLCKNELFPTCLKVIFLILLVVASR